MLGGFVQPLLDRFRRKSPKSSDTAQIVPQEIELSTDLCSHEDYPNHMVSGYLEAVKKLDKARHGVIAR